MPNLSKPLILSAFVAAAFSAQAAEPVTVYGKLNVTVQNNNVAGENSATIQSNASRLGVKGDFEINSKLEAFYTVEYEVDTSSSAKENFKARNQFVGLRGDFGAISVGRNDTMLKKSQGKVDQFNDISGDLKNLFKGEVRAEQTLTYVTPTFSGLKAGITWVGENSNKQVDAVKNETVNGFSAAVMYGDSGLKKTPIYAGLAYDNTVQGYDIVRGTVQGKIAGFKLGGMYQQQEQNDTLNDDGTVKKNQSDKGYLLSAAYGIDAVTLKVQYQDMERKGKAASIGADYKLASPTKLFAFYTQRDLDEATKKDNYFGIGLEHKF
ncbi:porin [Paraferrimonas sedimenticola]|uniref:Porin n=1 Tax=Paraferrimonas sedimenticola TaxID=375674 RepID=A0AA37RT36_9GAMM|nr:porin [Paraferrimonas sedimenticola]GLP95028.1 porin [Paraferrimonas sedimenticola]